MSNAAKSLDHFGASGSSGPGYASSKEGAAVKEILSGKEIRLRRAYIERWAKFLQLMEPSIE